MAALCARNRDDPVPARVGGTYTGTEVGWSVFCPDSEGVYEFVDDVVRSSRR